MAKGVIVKNTLTPQTKRICKEFRVQIMNAIADSFDHIREVAAAKYIIPNKVGIERRPWILAKMQPSDPVRLTSRTGALIKMLKIKGRRQMGNRRMLQHSPGIQYFINIGNKGISKNETYVATMNAIIKDASAVSSRVTSKQLAARFFWDLPRGIRGRRRPFVTPAAEEEPMNFSRLVKAKLDRLGVT